MEQNSVSLSTAEAEYIAARSCCAEQLWMRKLLHDYGITQDTMCVFCNNTTATKEQPLSCKGLLSWKPLRAPSFLKCSRKGHEQNC